MTVWSSCQTGPVTVWGPCDGDGDGESDCCLSDTFTDTDGTPLQDHTPEAGSWTRVGADNAEIQGNAVLAAGADVNYLASCDSSVTPFAVQVIGVFGDGVVFAHRSGTSQLQVGFGDEAGIDTIMLARLVSGSLAAFDFVQYDGISTFDLVLTVADDTATLVGTTNTGAVDLTLDITGFAPGTEVGFTGASSSLLAFDEFHVCPPA